MLAMFQALYRASGNLDVTGAAMQRLWCFRNRVSQNVYNLFCCNRYDVFYLQLQFFVSVIRWLPCTPILKTKVEHAMLIWP